MCVWLAQCVSMQCPVCSGACSVDWGCNLLHLSVQHSARMIGSRLCVRSAKKSSHRRRQTGCVRGANSPSTHRWETEVDLADTQVSLRKECHALFRPIKCEIESENNSFTATQWVFSDQIVSTMSFNYVVNIVYLWYGGICFQPSSITPEPNN